MADFAVAIKRQVPRGSAFRAFPIAFNHISPSRAWCTLLASPAAREIIEVSVRSVCVRARLSSVPVRSACTVPRSHLHNTRALSPPPLLLPPSLQTPCHADPSHTLFSLRVQVTAYPEDTVAAWVMLGVCTMVPTKA